MTMPRAQELLRDVFGFDGFRTGQRQVIEHILAGRPVPAMRALLRCERVVVCSGCGSSGESLVRSLSASQTTADTH